MKQVRLFFGAMIVSVFFIALAACAAPTPQVVKETVRETVVVAGTPQVVEKVVEKVITPTPGAAAAQDKVTLDTCIGTEPPSFDPALATDSTSHWYIQQMFVGLADINEKAEVVPMLATEWKTSADGLKWTFKLRNDIPWVKYNTTTNQVEQIVDKDKKPVMVTAKDVEYAVKRTLNPKTASSYAFFLYLLKGANEFNSADLKTVSADALKKLEDAVGVKAVDDTTLEFTLTNPTGFFPAIAAMWPVMPQNAAAIKQWGEQRWTEAGYIVTSGPYTLKEWTHQAKVVIVKNPFWPDAKNVQVEVVQGPIVQSESTCMQMYEKGEIDFMSQPGWTVPLPDMDRVKKDAKLSKELYIAPRLCTYYYGFVNTRKPFDNPVLRKALAAAIDRQTLIDTLLKGEQKPAHTFTSPGNFGNAAADTTIAPYLLDYKDGLAKSKQWMKDAGYPDGDGLKVRIGHNVSEAHGQIAQAVQSMWKTAFPKIDVKIETQEMAVYLNTLLPTSPDANKPDVYRLGWCADYPDANNWVNEVFNPKSGTNYARYNNPKFTELVEGAAKEPNAEKRVKMYNDAERIFIEQDMGIAPIYYYSYVNMYKPYLTKHPIRPVGGDPIRAWVLDVNAKKAARGGK
jgi:oligopeptide transport system substrate-binding protein